MNFFIMAFKDAGPFAYWLPLGVLVFGATGLGALGCWFMNWRFPPAIALWGLFLGVLAPLAAEGWSTRITLEAVAFASPEMKQTLIAAGISVSMFMHWLPKAFLLMPGVVFIVLASVAGGMRGPRRMGPPAGALALGLIATFASGVAAVMSETGFIHPVAYLAAAIAIALGLSGAHSEDPDQPKSAGPTAAAAAAMAFPMIVALGEMGSVANGQIQVFEAVAHSPTEMKGALLEAGLAVVYSGRMWSWLAIAASSGVALLGAGAALDDDASHNAGVLAGLTGVVAGALAFHLNGSQLFAIILGEF